MSEELRAICVKAVSSCENLPPTAKENKEAVSSVAITLFDQSYIERLDGEIALAPRGREWNNRLMIRRDHLANYAGRELADCRLRLGSDDYWIKIDPIAGSVVHWEVYDESE